MANAANVTRTGTSTALAAPSTITTPNPLLAPLVLDRPTTRHRVLGSATMVTLGRWSYGLFIWHLAALDMVFPVVGRYVFTGDFPIVLVLTSVFGFAIAAVSYALVEEPCRVALRRWEFRRKPPVQTLDSSATTASPPAQTRAA